MFAEIVEIHSGPAQFSGLKTKFVVLAAGGSLKKLDPPEFYIEL